MIRHPISGSARRLENVGNSIVGSLGELGGTWSGSFQLSLFILVIICSGIRMIVCNKVLFYHSLSAISS